ncbi:hypothetical protein CEE69_30385 [Rhodopirellula bahusiensis]|uniref:Uncharacterized protein n=2 Tax=Rhodopirellula bahusiensis TaxID=2014065 RepID=A0A2G1VYU3_9BACT|nr:hypothetical protein CEE69_30385 [Rhodopirellula bahusiensis]
MNRSRGLELNEVDRQPPRLGYAHRSPSKMRSMTHKLLLVAFAFLSFAASPRNASSCDETNDSDKPTTPLYLHLLGTNRAIHHDPEDWRPESEDKSAPVWSCVATIQVHANRDFYFRAPGNREPYVKVKGRAIEMPSAAFDIRIEYELDDSNMTYIQTEKFKTKLDHFIYLADGIYWRGILSRCDDAYDAFDLAQSNATPDRRKNGEPIDEPNSR